MNQKDYFPLQSMIDLIYIYRLYRQKCIQIYPEQLTKPCGF